MSAFPRPSFTPFLLPFLLYLLTRLSPIHHSPPSPPSPPPLPQQSSLITARLTQLANISSSPYTTNRPYLSPSSQLAQSLIQTWMASSHLHTRIDAAGNVIGDLLCHHTAPRPHLLLGSHHDTVASAGRFDGLLGVLSAIAVADSLSAHICDLPFDLRIIAFDDEEGNNAFGTTNLGSKAYSGLLYTRHDIADINTFISAYQAIHPGTDPVNSLTAAKSGAPLAYLELHIEQGPVLERRSAGVGVVDAIAGQTRLSVTFTGSAGHAGTVPMGMRSDALAAAAECVLAVESAPAGVVGTVGKLSAGPGVGNVIPGSARLSVDIRAREDDERTAFVEGVIRKCEQAGGRRGVGVESEVLHNVEAVGMTDWVTKALDGVAKGGRVTSGAGHDAQIMAGVTDVGMLFVRCKGGVSHTPEEFVEERDVQMGVEALGKAVWAIAKEVRE